MMLMSLWNRLLYHSGIDPRHALTFWENRLASKSTLSPPTTADACGFLSSHPVDAERVEKIKEELSRWESHPVVVKS